MSVCTRLLIVTLLVAPATLVRGQEAVDASGHWHGAVRAPHMEIEIEIDLVRSAAGQVTGTFGQPAQQVKGLPLSTIAVSDRTVRFVVRGGDAPATFAGVLGADGQSMTGEVAQAGATLPFTLTRAGDARVTPQPRSAAIGKELEGVWNGTLQTGERQMRIVVAMRNQADGTAAGTIVSADGSGVEIPIGMTQEGSTVTIEVASVGASYSAILDASTGQLSGTWTQAGAALPLTLRRAMK